MTFRTLRGCVVLQAGDEFQHRLSPDRESWQPIPVAVIGHQASYNSTWRYRRPVRAPDAA